MLDYYLAPYVAISYACSIAKEAKSKFDLSKEDKDFIKGKLKEIWKKHGRLMNETGNKLLKRELKNSLKQLNVEYTDEQIESVFNNAYDDTYDETFQSMEALVHNLNTMHSRAGAQVPFSSINYGTDTSTEGRMIQETLLKTTWEGLGNGETPIFPIQILKLKKGINMDPGDHNYDLFQLACKVSAARLYPNFVNLDAPYNAELYVEGHPETEMATMGCVESSEIINYKIGNKTFIEPFERAYKRIKDLYGETKYSENSNYVNVEDKDVYIRDKGKYTKVKKFIKNTNVKNLQLVKFSNGYSLTATSDHPLPVVGKGRTMVKDLMPEDAIEITEEVYEGTEGFSTKYFGSSLDSAWLLGVMLSSTSFRNNSLTLNRSLTDKGVIDKFDSVLKSLNYSMEIREQFKKVNGEYVDASKRELMIPEEAKDELSEIFEGNNKTNRIVTTKLINAPVAVRKALLAGIIDSRGTFDVATKKISGTTEYRKTSGKISISTSNKSLAMTELYLIRGLGYKASLTRSNRLDKDKNISLIYVISIEITDGLLSLLCNTKLLKNSKEIPWRTFGNESTARVLDVMSSCDRNEISDVSYDVETESDTFDVSFIHSHNCRTRVGKNVYDPTKSVIPGRGNLSFTSINLPRLGIKAAKDINKFYKLLDVQLDIVHRELLERLEIISKRKPLNYPFLMGQGCWIDSEKLGPTDNLREIWKHGTLTVGFIGLAETLVALTGKHHGESEESQKLGLEIVSYMRKATDAWSENEHLNYSLLGTPAEGLSGRFIKADKKLFGVIPGVTDRDYYTNSSHVPVYYPISAKKKIDIEAPYHELENGGHILYIEMDGDPVKNLKAFEKVVRYMHDKNAGYMAINHPVDADTVCGYRGIINDVCPRCGRREGEPMSMEMWNKIKAFTNVGNADTLGYHGDSYEEQDRIENSTDEFNKQ